MFGQDLCVQSVYLRAVMPMPGVPNVDFQSVRLCVHRVLICRWQSLRVGGAAWGRRGRGRQPC